MLLTNNETDIILDKNQLLEIFFRGCKTQENIGVESEKLLVYKNSYEAVKYSDVVKILEKFDENKWQKYYENGNLMGLKSEIGTISLEPGSQVEISLKPFRTLDEITTKLQQYYIELSSYAEEMNAIVLNSGIQPISTFNDIKIIPKQRYGFMTKYLPTRGNAPFIMMRETAGIQANFDYTSEEDAIRKLSLALKMSPIISTIYANSPIRGGKLTGYKSNRTNSWLNVDEQRCGYISKKLFDKDEIFTFKDYAEVLLDIPMIFVQRGNTCFETSQTFREFMQKGFMGMRATLTDWETHLSLFFPDVRLKSYVEIRNHDAQNSSMTFSVPAFWKGIMYRKAAMQEIENILAKYDYQDFMELRENSLTQSINAKLGKYSIIDLAKEFFDISYASLSAFKEKEEIYLIPMFEYLALKRIPADDLIDNFNK